MGVEELALGGANHLALGGGSAMSDRAPLLLQPSMARGGRQFRFGRSMFISGVDAIMQHNRQWPVRTPLARGAD